MIAQLPSKGKDKNRASAKTGLTAEQILTEDRGE
jgi:hypothetical protein